MSEVTIRSRTGKQTGVMDAYGNFNPGDAMSTGLDQLITYGIDSTDGEGEIEPGDPSFEGVGYALSGTWVNGTGAVLTWTSPFLAPANCKTIGFWIQRSKTKDDMPHDISFPIGNDFGGSGVLAKNLNRTQPGAEVGWTDVKHYTAADGATWATLFPNAGAATWTDTAALTDRQPYAYRAIFIFYVGSDTGVNHVQLNWNSIRVIPPQTSLLATPKVSSTCNPACNYTQLTWATPISVPGDYFDFMTVIKNGSNKEIRWNWTESFNPDSYELWKLYAPPHTQAFELVASFSINRPQPFLDGDTALPVSYFMRAKLAGVKGPDIDSLTLKVT